MSSSIDVHQNHPSMKRQHEFLIIGHRGAAGAAEENTEEAILFALQHGVRCLEWDVRRTLDGMPVVWHDSTWGRLCHDKRTVSSTHSHQLPLTKQGHRVLFLGDALLLCKKQCALHIEIKDIHAIPATIMILESMAAADLIDVASIVLSSFDHSALVLARQNGWTGRTLALFEGALDVELCRSVVDQTHSDAIGIDWASWSNTRIDKQSLQAALGRDVHLFCYTVNTLQDAVDLQEAGFSGVYSDVPHILMPQPLMHGSFTRM